MILRMQPKNVRYSRKSEKPGQNLRHGIFGTVRIVILCRMALPSLQEILVSITKWRTKPSKMAARTQVKWE